MITAQQLKRIFPTCAQPEIWAAAISGAWGEFGFVTIEEQAGYLGVVGNETGGLRQTKREVMNYTVERACEIFPRAREYPAVCAMKIRQGPEAFANWIYAGVIGNGGELSGDGWKYRGNGIVQLTGRGNHRAADMALGTNLEADPESMADPAVSARVAAWFMASYVKPPIKNLFTATDSMFLAGAAKVGWVDAGGQQRRLAYRAKALEVLSEPPVVSAPIVKSKTGAGLGTAAAGTTVVAPNAQGWADQLSAMAQASLPDVVAGFLTPGVIKWSIITAAVAPVVFVAFRYWLKSRRGEVIHT